MILLELFWAFFQVGLFSVGGGYAALPLIQHQAVDLHGWITMTQFTDMFTISEMTPGVIALNASTFVGTQVAGFGGAVVATLGCIAPSCIIVSVLAFIYFKYKNLSVVKGVLSGLRPAVVSLIGSAGLTIVILSFWGELGFAIDGLGMTAVDFVAVAIFTAALLVIRKARPNPIFVMCGCGLVGGAVYLAM